MADDEDVVEAELVEDTPKFLHAILGIRSLDDIKAILTHEEYNPHVHMAILLFCVFLVGTISFLVGA
jgi:hypothetical protein